MATGGYTFDFYYVMRSLLFEGLSRAEVGELFACLGPEFRHYERGQVIFRAGEPVTHMGMVLEGAVRVECGNVWGENTLLVMVEPGKTFGEAYACGTPGKPLLIDIVADKDSQILMFDVEKLMTPCLLGCERHRRAATNFTRLLALRNTELSRRAFITAPRTIREKVQSYLSFQAAEHASASFDIPLNREQMAAYLGVDRSALSAELSRMKAEGLIDYHMRHFEISERAQVAQEG